MENIEIILALLGAMSALVVLARRINVPYPILLVIGGLGISLIPNLPHIELEPELVFLLFLPPIKAGRDTVKEWQVRPIAAEPEWQKQRKAWRALNLHLAGAEGN